MQAIRAAVASRRIAAAATRPAQMMLARGVHVEMGAREKELLADDPVLKSFSGTKATVKKVHMVADTVILVLGAGFLYEVYYRWKLRRNKAIFSPGNDGQPHDPSF